MSNVSRLHTPPHRTAARATPVFEDPRSCAVLAEARRVAPSEATVLIVGATGTGKEVLAREVHERSGREGPFVAINCAALADTLVDAELFGHEAGAYTGASHARAGWFEAADGGTLFLDEIGDLSPLLQVRLLRVLQERQVVRLGSRKTIDVDVRLVAATHVDLAAAVEAGRFRRDLYYRLNIALLRLPPLAERPADIAALADHFVVQYSRRLGRAPVGIGADARAALLAHRWPGNIRELENAIHYALIVGGGTEIRAEHLRLRAIEEPAPGIKPSGDASGLDWLGRGLRGLFEAGGHGLYDSIERHVVHAAYEFCQRNQVHTAELLGISRNVLRAQLKRFGLLPVRAAADAAAHDAGCLVSHSALPSGG